LIDSFGTLDEGLKMKLQLNQELVHKDQTIWNNHLNTKAEKLGRDSCEAAISKLHQILADEFKVPDQQ
jgi:hypothetical protein